MVGDFDGLIVGSLAGIDLSDCVNEVLIARKSSGEKTTSLYWDDLSFAFAVSRSKLHSCE